MKSRSLVRLFVTPWTAAHQAPPSMGFSRQEYWSGVPLPSPSVKHLTLINFKTVNYPERKHKIFKPFNLSFVLHMRKEEIQIPSICQTAPLESGASSVKGSSVRGPQCYICNDSHHSPILFCKFTNMLAFISVLTKTLLPCVLIRQ